ncbi:SH3 domain-containing protein [Microbacterium sp. ZW T2_14]|uniref:SH3 domain-containing protein n=1 Tax=Microbacterium sp. ZW T2_14 TaxID=3378079 RepID=UPI003852AD26
MVGVVAAVFGLAGALLLAPAVAQTDVSAATSKVAAVDAAGFAVATESVPAGVVKAADLSQFQAGNIISDAKFFDRGTMGEAQIQQFLQSKVPSCQSGYVCLKDWYDTSRATNADAMCGAYPGGYRERASAIIYKVAQACGINPQVLIVMLQKEQRLVTHTWPSEWRYTIAMGQGCPDTAACDTRYYGFFNQVYGAAWQLKRYGNPPGTSQYFTWYAPGKTWNVRWHPDASCGSSPVYIQNQATADLYYYTPYQPNAASLRAGYGEASDPCSSYGNRNFFQYFTDWFGSTTDSCAQPPFEQVRSASGIMTAATAVPARIAPSEGCNPDALWLPPGLAVSVQAEWSSWYWVNVGGNMRWMLKSHLVATDPCAQPPYTQVRSASGIMVTAGTVTARSTANSGCEAGAVQIAAGARVVIAAEWAEWYWVDHRGTMVWVLKNQVKDPCTQPPYAEVRSATGTMVTSTIVTARAAANVDCATGSVTLAQGTKVTLTAQWADWYWVNANGAMLWVPKTQLVASVDPCTQPPFEQVRSASGTMVTARDVSGRGAPAASCNVGLKALVEGAKIVLSAEWSDWYWVNAGGSMVWILKSDLKAYVPCAQPPFSQVSSASGILYAAATITARLAPDDACVASSTQLSPGAQVSVLAKWSDWYWVEYGTAHLWVRASDLVSVAPSTCVQPRYEEVVSASGSATVRSGAVARPAPSSSCTAGAISPAAGATVTLHARWSQWYWVEVGGQMLWITGEGLQLQATVTTTVSVNLRASASTAAPVMAVIPSGTTLSVRSQTTGWYEVSYQSRTGWVSSDYVR